MSSAETQPRIDMDQIITDFHVIHGPSFQNSIPVLRISQSTDDFLNRVFADAKFGDFRRPIEKAVGFNAFKEASSIFEKAIGRPVRIREKS